MAIAMSLRDYLDRSSCDYEVVNHTYTTTSMSTAQAAHIPGDKLAKSVLLEDDDGYVMAVIPSTHYVALGQISQQLNRHLGLATEDELDSIFTDCDPGAVPPVGGAYGVEVIMDDCLTDCSDVYFESGDHTKLVHMDGEDFLRLMRDADIRQISHHVQQ